MTEAERQSLSTCAGCGKPILWGTDEGGKRIPLDPRAPCYDRDDAGNVYRVRGCFVSHFATCSSANNFSKGALRPARFTEEEIAFMEGLIVKFSPRGDLVARETVQEDLFGEEASIESETTGGER